MKDNPLRLSAFVPALDVVSASAGASVSFVCSLSAIDRKAVLDLFCKDEGGVRQIVIFVLSPLSGSSSFKCLALRRNALHQVLPGLDE
jgi:hypothetical protein